MIDHVVDLLSFYVGLGMGRGWRHYHCVIVVRQHAELEMKGKENGNALNTGNHRPEDSFSLRFSGLQNRRIICTHVTNLPIGNSTRIYLIGAVNGISGILKEEAKAIINIRHQPVPRAKGGLIHYAFVTLEFK